MRVLLKLSGEVLSGEGRKGYSRENVEYVLDEIESLLKESQLAVVMGAGNIVRGRELSGIGKLEADQIGMLGTVMNAIYLSEALKKRGIESVVFSNIVDLPSVRRVSYGEIESVLESGGIAVFGGGTSNPLFTTDTAAVLRAVEIGASKILKATKVDGVYDSDPMENPNAKRFDRLTFHEALKLGLEVMDAEAFSLCEKHGIEVVVYDFFKKGNSLKALKGLTGTVISGG